MARPRVGARAELGREPTPDEIAAVTGIGPDEVDSINRWAQAPVSLEKPVGDEEESEFGQFIADERAESPYERAAEILTKEALREALGNLGYRERRVLGCGTASAASIRAHSEKSAASSTSRAGRDVDEVGPPLSRPARLRDATTASVGPRRGAASRATSGGFATQPRGESVPLLGHQAGVRPLRRRSFRIQGSHG